MPSLNFFLGTNNVDQILAAQVGTPLTLGRRSLTSICKTSGNRISVEFSSRAFGAFFRGPNLCWVLLSTGHEYISRIRNSVTSVPTRATAVPLIPPQSSLWAPSHLCQIRARTCVTVFSTEPLFAPQCAPPIPGSTQSFSSCVSTPPKKSRGEPCEHPPRGLIYFLHISSASFAASASVSSLPAMPNGRFSGQRLNADQTLINHCFANDSRRRTLLDRIL